MFDSSNNISIILLLCSSQGWRLPLCILSNSTHILFFFILFISHYQDRDLGDEYGWKQVHGDVFRPSSHPLIFSSLIGSGCQIFSVSLIVIILAMIEDLYTEWVLPMINRAMVNYLYCLTIVYMAIIKMTLLYNRDIHLDIYWKVGCEGYSHFLKCSSKEFYVFPCRRGSMLSTAIFVYAATSPVNGYFGGSLYAKQGGMQTNICNICDKESSKYHFKHLIKI